MFGALKNAANAGGAAVWSRAARFGAAIAALGFALTLLPFVAALEENVGLDWLFQNRGFRVPPPQVTVVSIDKRSALELGMPKEPHLWSRSLHADLVKKLAAAGATAIAFDIYFDKPREPAADRKLGAAIRDAGNVILFEYIEKDVLESALPGGADIMTEKLIRPIDEIGSGALLTASFPLPVVPIKVSRFWTFMTAASDVATLPVAAIHAHTRGVQPVFGELLRAARPDLADEMFGFDAVATSGWETTDMMRKLRLAFLNDAQLGPRMLALLAGRPEGRAKDAAAALIRLYAGPGSYYLNFYGPPRTFPTLSYADVLTGSELTGDLAGQMMFVGYSAEMQPEQQDSFYSVYSQTTGLNLSGVEIAATAFANLVDGAMVRPLGGWESLLLVVGWGLVVGIVTYLTTPVIATLASALLAAGYLAFSAWQFSTSALWLPLVTPLTQLLFAWVSMLAWKLLLTRARFGQFVPRGEVDRLSVAPDIDVTGDWAYRVLLSADVASYTTTAERYTGSDTDADAEQRSEALWMLMNDYFTVINKAVEARGGIVCDQEGDSSIAVWESRGDAAAARTAALHAALEMQSAMDTFHATRVREFNRHMRDTYGVLEELALPTRIGVHAGRVRMGKIGGGHHYEFHVFGDPVNTVSRIQQYNKQAGTRVLVSEEVLDGVAGAVVNELGAIELRGKRNPLRLFELQSL